MYNCFDTLMIPNMIAPSENRLLPLSFLKVLNMPKAIYCIFGIIIKLYEPA